jgi:phosphatidylglycerol:prolipoprotein diacylglycerol transferase
MIPEPACSSQARGCQARVRYSRSYFGRKNRLQIGRSPEVMYPVLFRIGDFEITSFGVLVAIAAAVGLWMYKRELDRDGLPGAALDAAIAGVLGGLAGAKLLWVAEHADEAPLADLVLSRGGMSWFGGLAGGVLSGAIVMRRHRVPIVPALAAATPALTVGHAIGRIGCFLVGDDYGKPTSLPWGVAFPQGLPPTDVPVHPTQLYEAAALLPVTWVLIRLRRRGAPPAQVLGTYLLFAGLLRFAIEFLRINPRVVGPLSVAHVAALGATVAGLLLMLFGKRRN